jgi:hypothetical protein
MPKKASRTALNSTFLLRFLSAKARIAAGRAAPKPDHRRILYHALLFVNILLSKNDKFISFNDTTQPPRHFCPARNLMAIIGLLT